MVSGLHLRFGVQGVHRFYSRLMERAAMPKEPGVGSYILSLKSTPVCGLGLRGPFLGA